MHSQATLLDSLLQVRQAQAEVPYMPSHKSVLFVGYYIGDQSQVGAKVSHTKCLPCNNLQPGSARRHGSLILRCLAHKVVLWLRQGWAE